jgi:ubiquitin C-terminal hydrolase
MEGGHYTAVCKNELYNKWYEFDDHRVCEISDNDVCSGAAYVLFYTSLKYKAPVNNS